MQNQADDTRNNLDKRTARIRHAEWFKKGIEDIRATYSGVETNPPHTLLQAIRVYARIRPMLEHEVSRGEYTTISCVGRHTVAVHNCMMRPDMVHKYIETHAHDFTHVFDENANTEAVYKEVAEPLVDHVRNGGESVCMMYGQTGSGKTHTMTGFLEDMGRDLMHFGNSIQVTAVELVGSKCVDLLHERTKVLICESEEDQSIHLVHSKSKVAHSPAELIQLFQEAVSQRATESTQANTVSSRSHLILFLKIVEEDPNRPSGGQMVLLDLAGSERKEDQFTNDKQRQQETIETNMSHLALKQCLLAMAQNNHVPYRNSALTRILKNSLWASHKSCKAAIIVTASPIPADTEHTLCSLINARRMVEIDPPVNLSLYEIVESTAKPLKMLKTFSHIEVQEWLTSVGKGELGAYVDNIKAAITGAALLRLPPARLTQLCNGNATHAKLLAHAIKETVAKEQEEKAREREQRRLNMAKK